MLLSHASIFSEMAQASPTKHSLARCNYNLCDLMVRTPFCLDCLNFDGPTLGQVVAMTFLKII